MVTQKSIEWGGKTLKLETGRIARQADGAVLATYGATVVLATVVGKKKADNSGDFFPLTVNYQERFYATGRIPGGFFKREGRPTEKETLTSRLIDRPIRPLFASNYRNETQVICTVLSRDQDTESDILSIIAASAALTISGLPFMGPIGAARIGYIEGKLVLNPKMSDMKDSKLDLCVAGTREGVLMVESEAQELSEETMLEAVNFGHQESQPVIDLIIKLAEEAAKEPWKVEALPEDYEVAAKKVASLATDSLRQAYSIQSKQKRVSEIEASKKSVLEELDNEFDTKLLADLLKSLESDLVRKQVLDTGLRIDGRDTQTVRPIVPEVGILPQTHGSSLFTRGETQALVTVTLGTAADEQLVDAIEGEHKERFMLHYNFPPFSVGEVGRTGSPGRREIGHGKLAWRAIRPLLPNKDSFPYTIRTVSEITESNGSSSMATVCGTSLALMDAGVPLVKSIAGIAMGLIKEGDKFVILSDILGDEDHLGDMDFKVAGSLDGITALQMDIKITSITPEIMQIALEQARKGRIHILGEMAQAITGGRNEISSTVPRITTFKINKDKIREVIGTGGKVIREIQETTGVKIDIEEDGTISIASIDNEKSQRATDWIKNIVAEPEIGAIYKGKVVKVVDFGAFVNFLGSKDGLVHISELANHRVKTTTDICREGDEIFVKIIGFDRGKVKLSMRLVDQKTGEDLGDDS